MNVTEAILIPKWAQWMIVLAFVSLAIVSMWVSYYAYVILPHRMTPEFVEELLETLCVMPLNWFVGAYLISLVRYRMVREGMRYVPFGVKIVLSGLGLATVSVFLVVVVWHDCIQDIIQRSPAWCHWMMNSSVYIPLFFSWMMFTPRDGMRGKS